MSQTETKINRSDCAIPKRIFEYSAAGSGELRQVELGAEVGSGSMCTVFEATDTSNAGEKSARRVAVKILSPEFCGTPTEERFAREGELLCRLSHPNLVRGYGMGTISTNAGASVPFIVMELLDGRPLSDVICASRLADNEDGDGISSETSIGFEDAIGIISDIASALAYMTMDGRLIAHRDIKPSNIIIGENGAKLIDLGVAKTAMVASKPLETRLVGTIRYMSPEQIADCARADARSDIYSLGIVLFEMLGGKLGSPERHQDGARSANSDERAIVADRFSGKSPRLSRFDAKRLGLSTAQAEALDECLSKMCAYEPHKRFQGFGELLECLASIKESGEQSAGKHSRSKMTKVVLAVSVLIALVLGPIAVTSAMHSHQSGIAGESQNDVSSAGQDDGSRKNLPPEGKDIVLGD